MICGNDKVITPPSSNRLVSSTSYFHSSCPFKCFIKHLMVVAILLFHYLPRFTLSSSTRISSNDQYRSRCMRLGCCSIRCNRCVCVSLPRWLIRLLHLRRQLQIFLTQINGLILLLLFSLLLSSSFQILNQDMANRIDTPPRSSIFIE